MPFRSHVAALVLCFACMPVAGHCAGATPIDQVAVGAPVQITIPAEATSDEGTYGTRCLRIDLDAGQGYAFTATTPPGGDRFVALSQYRQPDCKTGILNDDYSHSGRLTFKFRSSGGGSYFMLVRAHAGPVELSMERIDGSLAVQRIGNGLSLADSEHDSMQASADGAEKQPGATESNVALTSQATAGEIATRLAVGSTATQSSDIARTENAGEAPSAVAAGTTSKAHVAASPALRAASPPSVVATPAAAKAPLTLGEATRGDPWGPLAEMVGKSFELVPEKEFEWNKPYVMRYSWLVPGKKIKSERADRAGVTVYALDKKTGALTVTHDGKPSDSTWSIRGDDVVIDRKLGEDEHRDIVRLDSDGIIRGYGQHRFAGEDTLGPEQRNGEYRPVADFGRAQEAAKAKEHAELVRRQQLPDLSPEEVKRLFGPLAEMVGKTYAKISTRSGVDPLEGEVRLGDSGQSALGADGF